MYRIGILGSENSHAMAFSRAFNGLDQEVVGEFDDIQVVGTFSLYPEANQQLMEQCGLEFIADRPEDMLGRVDAVMVTARDGKYHAEYARPFLEAGIPAFIDKPFDSNGEAAIALAKLAKEKKVPLVGGSTLKLCAETRRMAALVQQDPAQVMGGSVVAPVSMKNEYGDFYFYSSHLAEILMPVFGYYPEWVMASETVSGVGILVHYPNFDVSGHYAEGMYDYTCTVIRKDGVRHTPIHLDNAYTEECRGFARMLRQGNMEYSYEQLVQPVMLLNAIERSLKTGLPQPVAKAEL